MTATALKDPRRYFEAVDARETAGDRAAGLPLSGGHQPLQPAVRDLPAHLRGARAAGGHELGAVHLASSTRCPDVARVVLHGVGEPMLVKALPRMIRYLKDRGIYVLFNTNGTLLSRRSKHQAMIDTGLDELRVSLDAAEPRSFLRGARQELLRSHRAQRRASSPSCSARPVPRRRACRCG